MPDLAGKPSEGVVFLELTENGRLIHMTLKKNLFVALIAGCAIAMTASNSFAWGHHGGSCGSYGGGWGSYGGGWGSYGGSYGGGGSWGGYSGGSCGSCGSCGSYGGGGYAYSGYYGGGYASTRVIYEGVATSKSSS